MTAARALLVSSTHLSMLVSSSVEATFIVVW